MVRNYLRITHQNDIVRLSWQRANTQPRFADPFPFQHPFDQDALDELRWYLEKFLEFPYGIEPDKAKKTEDKLQEWGSHLFDTIFRSNETARIFFQEATRDGLDNCELSISSDDPAVLNLPWELLYTSDYQFLAPQLAGMYRSLSEFAIRAPSDPAQQDTLNVLLVIARPYGKRDIGVRTIARPLLDALKPIRSQVRLKVLRPPSFDEFQKELNAHKGHYHIVHFDGHGTFDPHSRGMRTQLGDGEGQGLLVFETPDGEPDPVTAERIAQNLADCRVPAFVLNACKSGQAGEREFSSVAANLVKLGAKGVVAMAYSVYAKAAEVFVGRLYEQLAAGESLSGAVAAGRKHLINNFLRPSPKGDLPLRDWLVPVLYQQEPYAPLPERTSDNSFAALLQQATAEPATPTTAFDVPEAGTYGFVGRDYDLLDLERAFRRHRLVVLKGMGGTGKTELAKGFARWLHETEGRSGGVFFTSFEQGATVHNVIHQIGERLGGRQFVALMPEQKRQVVLQYLKTNPCLLLWDNFEPVAGFAGNLPLLNAEERESLNQFLRELREGQSWVLVTSRREESWLDCESQLVELKGLSVLDAEALAAKILERAGVKRETLPSEYLELLKLLGGHPLALRVVLPKLKTQSPAALLEVLRLELNTVDDDPAAGRDKSLTASLDCSFSSLSERARRHLPFLALFVERVNADWLYAFSGHPDDDDGRAYRAVFGENLQETDWLQLLEEATDAGILEHLDSRIYKIHPALPWYLRQRLQGETSDGALAELEKNLLIFYAALAYECRKQLVRKAELAASVLWVEEPNLLQQLRRAEQQESWKEAQFILEALGELYDRTSRQRESYAIRHRIADRLRQQLSKEKIKDEFALNALIYIRETEAEKALQCLDLGTAEEKYKEILGILTKSKNLSINSRIGTVHHQLGLVGHKNRDFSKARNQYKKAIKIYLECENKYDASSSYHQLGILEQQQGYFQEAKKCYEKSCKIYEEYGDMYKASLCYNQIGTVAHQQKNFKIANRFYYKALEIRKKYGENSRVAECYNNLGLVAFQEGELQKAEEYHCKALKIREDLGDLYEATESYHNLGLVLQADNKLEEAKQLYLKAFKIRKKIGNDLDNKESLYKAAGDCFLIAIIEHNCNKFKEAIAFYANSFSIYTKVVEQDSSDIKCLLQYIFKLSQEIGLEKFKKELIKVSKDSLYDLILEKLETEI